MVNADVHVLESRTRDRVLRVVSQEGPVSITGLVERLGLTETAVRRHVDGLAADGLVESREASGPRRRGPSRPRLGRLRAGPPGPRQRLRPPRRRGAALHALHRRRERGQGRSPSIASPPSRPRYADRLGAAGDSTAERADALVEALNADGFAASARPVGLPGNTGPGAGVQLCQGHCPVQHVATEFPELCEAETEAFSRLLGVHVQRLATLAHGDHVCTTFVPTSATTPSTTTERPTS